VRLVRKSRNAFLLFAGDEAIGFPCAQLTARRCRRGFSPDHGAKT